MITLSKMGANPEQDQSKSYGIENIITPELGILYGSSSGFVIGGKIHSSEYIIGFFSLQRPEEFVELVLQYTYKSVDEALIGLLIGAAVGVGVKYIRSR